MDRSLVVTGKNLEQALSKASVLLHCELNRVGYEIVQEGKAGRNGTVEVPFKLRVMAMAPTLADATSSVDAEEQQFTPNLPWLANTLAPLPPATFCKALEEAFVDAVRDAPIGLDLGPPTPAGEDAAIKEIPGDGVAAGTIVEFDGHVRVFGNVRKGAIIKATGNIQVVGEVEAATLDARGDITVGGGVLGTLRSAGGNIACKFVQGGNLDAPFGNVVIKESAMHANIHAGLKVHAGDVVIGGNCYGELRVDLRIAGSELGVPTVLIAGLNKRLNDRMEEIRLRVERHTVRLRECEKLRQELLPVEERGDELPIEDRVRLWKAAIRKGRIQADLQRLAREKSNLLGLVNTERASRVCIKDRIYPKVRVVVDDAVLELKRTTQYVTFSKDYDSGQLRTTSYQ